MIPKSQLISLSKVPGMGPRRIRALLREFPELEDITNLSKSDMLQVEGISGDLAAKTKGIDLVQVFHITQAVWFFLTEDLLYVLG